MSGPPNSPKRGEIWRVQFTPSVGAEIQKARPALVLSRDDVGILPLRVVVPVTTWQPQFAGVPWMIELDPNPQNGLSRKSVADCFQPRSFDISRFIEQLGKLDTAQVDEAARTVAAVLGV